MFKQQPGSILSHVSLRSAAWCMPMLRLLNPSCQLTGLATHAEGHCMRLDSTACGCTLLNWQQPYLVALPITPPGACELNDTSWCCDRRRHDTHTGLIKYESMSLSQQVRHRHETQQQSPGRRLDQWHTSLFAGSTLLMQGVQAGRLSWYACMQGSPTRSQLC